jgi:hypothetical protein
VTVPDVASTTGHIRSTEKAVRSPQVNDKTVNNLKEFENAIVSASGNGNLQLLKLWCLRYGPYK